ncbi:MAG: RNase adapter RapZ [Rhodobacteraceae bacterium]|nr:RNase adapter RapZ [Paracoccaceae bacterium]
MGDGSSQEATPSVDISASETSKRLVLVTGRSGAGRSTVINALEDIGFETVDTPPLSLVPEIAAQMAPGGAGVAIGVDSRCCGLSGAALVPAIAELRNILASSSGGWTFTLLFLDCSDEMLIRRYTETRRRHPLAPSGSIEEGLVLDSSHTGPLRDCADMMIDTTTLTAVALRREIAHRFDRRSSVYPSVSVLSFSYRRGLPAEADMVFDCRFLRNPHYVDSLRWRDGRDPLVARYVAEDPQYPGFMTRLVDLAAFLMPAFQSEGKSYLTIALGCTGGKHRSVATAEAFAATLRRQGWRINLRHREQEDLPRAEMAALEPSAARGVEPAKRPN